jgi:hypothetical protein
MMETIALGYATNSLLITVKISLLTGTHPIGSDSMSDASSIQHGKASARRFSIDSLSPQRLSSWRRLLCAGANRFLLAAPLFGARREWPFQQQVTRQIHY